jgi:hypothetical protein
LSLITGWLVRLGGGFGSAVGAAFSPSRWLGRYPRGTDENRAASPSAIVGWVKTASRSAVYGRPAIIATWTTAITSPASAPNAVKPRMRSPPSSMSALRYPPRLGEGPGPQYGLHRDLGQAVSDAALAGLPLAQADPGQLRVGEQATGLLPGNDPEAGPGTPTKASAGSTVASHSDVGTSSEQVTEGLPTDGPTSERMTGEFRSPAPTTEGADSSRAGRAGEFVGGQVIAGRYTLLAILGEGGMGTVYRAEQTQPVRRQVALKLIRIGMDSRAVVARFDAERQALALMEHPNCDRPRLPVRAPLELLVAPCVGRWSSWRSWA